MLRELGLKYKNILKYMLEIYFVEIFSFIFDRNKNKTDVMSAIAETSSPLKHNSDGSSSSGYAIGQIASLLSSQKKSQRPDKGGVLAMFDSVGSTSGPTCMTRPAFVPLKKTGRKEMGTRKWDQTTSWKRKVCVT